MSRKLWLDNLHSFNQPNAGSPIVVIDLRVQLHRLLLIWPHVELLAKNSAMLEAWCHAQWALILHCPLPWLAQPDQSYRVLVVDDTKAELEHGFNYWRNEYCLKLGLPRYKGNRGLGDVAKPQSYWQLHEKALAYVSHADSPIALFKQSGMEADDLAGEVWRQAMQLCKHNEAGFAYDGTGRQTFFWTCDGDWEQFVNDNANMLFANSINTKNSSRLRSELEIMQRYLANGWPIASPREISRMKSIYGDYGDNLMPGSPAFLFDLQAEPPVAFDKALQIKIGEELRNKASNICYEHYKRAKQWCYANKLPSIA